MEAGVTDGGTEEDDGGPGRNQKPAKSPPTSVATASAMYRLRLIADLPAPEPIEIVSQRQGRVNGLKAETTAQQRIQEGGGPSFAVFGRTIA